MGLQNQFVVLAIEMVENNHRVQKEIQEAAKVIREFQHKNPTTGLPDNLIQRSEKALAAEGSAIYPRYRDAMEVMDKLIELIESNNI